MLKILDLAFIFWNPRSYERLEYFFQILGTTYAKWIWMLFSMLYSMIAVYEEYLYHYYLKFNH